MIENVLFVEDEFLIAAMIEDVLEEIGIARVAHATGVAEAMALIDRERFDFALLDVNLGTENSFPIADRLLHENVPHVFMTGYDASFIERRADAMLLRKPVRPADLKRLLIPSSDRDAAA